MNKLVFVALVVFALVAGVASVPGKRSHNWRKEFVHYAKSFGKTYHSASEFNSRLNTYIGNMEAAAQHNSQNPHAHFGPGPFADFTSDEMEKYKGFKPGKKGKHELPIRNISLDEPHPIFRRSGNNAVRAPSYTTYDWCDAGVTTPVNDQGECGSCWAFSAMETVESYHALRTGSLVPLSAEQIVDCDVGNYDYGCGGGMPSRAYSYIQRAGGLASAAAYPYNYGNDGCMGVVGGAVSDVLGYAGIAQSETSLYQFLSAAGGGPLSVCVAASTWYSYQGGVLTSCDTSLDHCVQLTGYYGWGTSSPIWRVRNQWGTDWGEGGYIRIAIGGNLCLIADYATYVAAS